MAVAVKKYPTAEAAADAYLVGLLKFCGIAEGSVQHQQILTLYRMISPRPRGYNPTEKDAWCAIFLCAIAWGMGFRSWPWECSVPRIMAKAKADGIWIEGWSQTPRPGMWCLYDWGNDGTANHIGAVVRVVGNEAVVVEGNYNNTVKLRRITIGDGRVEGFVDVPFQELVEAPEAPEKALRPGDAGADVRCLQAFLAGAGSYEGNLDGDYGSATTVAVMGFQAANGLDVDGKAGPKTQTMIRSGEWAAKRKEVQAVQEKRYNTIEELPEYAKGAIQALIDAGALTGKGDGRLDLSEDMLRVLVVCARAMGLVSE